MFKGNIHQLTIESKLLANNLAGETPVRPVYVYTPPEAESAPSANFPVLYVLSPWTAAGRQQFDWKPFRESLPERMERLVAAGKQVPAIVVAPDLYTRYGGSQFIDSAFFGPHASHIIDELIPFVESRFPVRKGASHRGVFGRSSGGFGALRLAMDHPGHFAAVACHSGDLGFDHLFYGDLHTFARGLAKYKGDAIGFLQHAFTAAKLSSLEVHLLMLLGSCGFYSPNQKSAFGFDIPIDLHSGEIDQSTWQQWLANDPIQVAKEKGSELKNLKCLYLECGRFDQYNLIYGARQMHQKLNSLGVKHVYEEFDDNHSGTDYRYDVSLPQLIACLT